MMRLVAVLAIGVFVLAGCGIPTWERRLDPPPPETKGVPVPEGKEYKSLKSVD